jgi:hypothetical protein
LVPIDRELEEEEDMLCFEIMEQFFGVFVHRQKIRKDNDSSSVGRGT